LVWNTTTTILRDRTTLVETHSGEPQQEIIIAGPTALQLTYSLRNFFHGRIIIEILSSISEEGRTVAVLGGDQKYERERERGHH
jgi:hypothetical protein